MLPNNPHMKQSSLFALLLLAATALRAQINFHLLQDLEGT